MHSKVVNTVGSVGWLVAEQQGLNVPDLLKEAKLMKTSAPPCAFTAKGVLQQQDMVRTAECGDEPDNPESFYLPYTGIAISSAPKNSF